MTRNEYVVLEAIATDRTDVASFDASLFASLLKQHLIVYVGQSSPVVNGPYELTSRGIAAYLSNA